MRYQRRAPGERWFETRLMTALGSTGMTGTSTRNWSPHRVAWWEAEEVFFNQPRPIFEDTRHSRVEERFYVLGQTNVGRWLFVSFTIREDLIRPISARDMNARERKIYGLHAKKDPDVQ